MLPVAVLVLAATMIQAPSPAPATDADPAAAGEAAAARGELPAEGVVAKKERIICTRVRITGSYQTRRVCGTAEDRARHTEASRRKHEKMTMRKAH